MVIAENPASHKYDVAKEITISNAFFVTAGYSSFNESQKFAGNPFSLASICVGSPLFLSNVKEV